MALNSTSFSESPFEDPVPKNVQTVMIVILSVVASTGHVLVILAICLRRDLRSRTYLIILNLSIADLLYSAIFLPLEAREIFSSFSSCKLRGIISTLFILTSVNMLAFVSFERFMATNYPFKHRLWFTTKRILFGVVFVWLWCAVFTVYPAFTAGYGYDDKFLHCGVKWRSSKLSIAVFIFFHGILPSSVLIYCNLKIVQAVRMRASVGQSSFSGTFRIQREKRVTKTVIIVISAVLICFVPYTAVLYCYAITDNCGFSSEYVATSLWLVRCNCTVNPIIYGLMNSKFRNAFKEMLCQGNICSGA
jgi:hypothetical protein